MARLTLSLLGPLEVHLDGEPVTSLATSKVRALLAYLAVEAARLHRREVLSGLLWPDWPERSARTNLRNALSTLRTAIGDRDADPPYLSVTRETMQFNAQSDHWLDVAAFGDLADVGPAEPADRTDEAPWLIGRQTSGLAGQFAFQGQQRRGQFIVQLRERGDAVHQRHLIGRVAAAIHRQSVRGISLAVIHHAHDDRHGRRERLHR